MHTNIQICIRIYTCTHTYMQYTDAPNTHENKFVYIYIYIYKYIYGYARKTKYAHNHIFNRTRTCNLLCCTQGSVAKHSLLVEATDNKLVGH